jgi:tetratricopeptide (TPR) repeat protein
MIRSLLTASLLLFAAQSLEAQLSPLDLEESAEVARRAASAALKGQNRILFEALDIDGILRPALGESVWPRLTGRQREVLRQVVRETFGAALAPARSTPGEVAWSSARADGSRVAVLLGIRFGERWVKTLWSLSRGAPDAGWRIDDVALSDPGASLAESARRSLGPQPVAPRDRRQQARHVALPRLAFLAAILLVSLLAYRRIPPGRRILLVLTASAPATLFAIDGALAVRQALAEPYTVSENLPWAPWERWLRQARELEAEERVAEAAALWERAVAAGAPAGPVAYERGLAARERGDSEGARRLLEAALLAPDPAPGASRELALLDLSEGRSDEASARIERYLTDTGPDPDSLSILAVAETNLGHPRKALEAVREAQELLGGGTRAAILEARVRARAHDASGAVEALRRQEPEGGLDREALRADPAYLPIATEPAWVAFVNEIPAALRATPAPSR